MYKPKGNLALYITVAVIAAFTVVFCIVCSFTAFSTVTLNLNYYFVYKYLSDNAVSASSLSAAVESYGGVGYILQYEGKFYVTVACYYDLTSANSVLFNLTSAGVDCDVLAVSVTKKPLSLANSKNSDLFYGNINTLNQLGKIAYSCANALDKEECTQSGARETINSIRSAMNGLYVANEDNCFYSPLGELLTVCDDILSGGYVYSRNLRKLQIAAIDLIISVDMS